MKQLIEKLLCKHEWSIETRKQIQVQDGKGNVLFHLSQTTIYVCKKCRKFKEVRVWFDK